MAVECPRHSTTLTNAPTAEVMLVGLMFCALFVAVSFLAREQPENHYVLQKADRLMRTAGAPLPAN